MPAGEKPFDLLLLIVSPCLLFNLQKMLAPCSMYLILVLILAFGRMWGDLEDHGSGAETSQYISSRKEKRCHIYTLKKPLFYLTEDARLPILSAFQAHKVHYIYSSWYRGTFQVCHLWPLRKIPTTASTHGATYMTLLPKFVLIFEAGGVCMPGGWGWMGIMSGIQEALHPSPRLVTKEGGYASCQSSYHCRLISAFPPVEIRGWGSSILCWKAQGRILDFGREGIFYLGNSFIT